MKTIVLKVTKDKDYINLITFALRRLARHTPHENIKTDCLTLIEDIEKQAKQQQ